MHDEVVERTELITPEPAEALAGLLDIPLPDLGEGLPLLWHGIYLLDRAPQSVLGADGHRERGGIPSPPEPGRLRMFAGGRVERHGSLLPERLATRRSFVLKTSEKTGRSGRLTFITARHEISQDETIVITEDQDIVYLDAAPARADPIATPQPGEHAPGPATLDIADGSARWVVEVDPVLLFRFSALIYNAHRIHYDRDFARQVAKYPGLVVHGPLQALLMCELASRLAPPPMRCTFAYRLEAPLFEGQGLAVTAEDDGPGLRTAVADATGRVTASGMLSSGS